MTPQRRVNSDTSQRARASTPSLRFCLAAILVLAAWMRFGGVTNVGVRFDDEAAYAHDARLWSRSARLALDPVALGALVRGDKETIRGRMTALGVDVGERYVKPSQGYTFLGAGATLLFGDDPSSLAILNATLGTLSVGLLYLLGAAWFDRRTGLIAAAILAVSPFDILYARSLWAEPSGLFFTSLGLWFWTLGRSNPRHARRYYLWCGVALGYAAICHYRYAVTLLPLLIVDWLCRHDAIDGTHVAPAFLRPEHGGEAQSGLVFQARLSPGDTNDVQTEGSTPGLPHSQTPGMRGVVPSWIVLCIGAALPALFIEGLFQMAGLAARIVGGELPFPTFLGGAIEWGRLVHTIGLTTVGSTWFDVGVLNLLGACFARYQGVAAVGLSLVGVIVAWRRRGPARFLLVGPGVLLALLLFQRYELLRLFAPTIPMFCLAVAVGFFAVAERLYRMHIPRAAGLFIVGAFVVVPAAMKAIEVKRQHSDVAAACAFLAEHAGLVVLPADTNVRSKYQLYLPTDPERTMHARLYQLGSPQDVLASLRSGGEVWVVTDPQVWHIRDLKRYADDAIFRWWTEFEVLLKRDGELAAEFPHMTDSRWMFLAEGPGVAMLDEMRARRAGAIRIYHLPERAPAGRWPGETVTLRREGTQQR